MLGNKLINTNAGGGCTDTVDLYNPFPDGGGVALYQLNGNATDVSGNYDGTATSVTYGAGEFGQAGVFNGSSSWVDIRPLQDALNGGHYTFSVWINPTDLSGIETIIYTQTVKSNFRLLLVDNVLYQEQYTAAVEQKLIIYTGILANTWTHIAGLWDGSDIKLYVNGSNVGSTPCTSIRSYESNHFRIGKYIDTPTPAYFKGSIDQVRIFSRALRPYEVEALYTEEYCTPTIVPSEHFNTVLYTGNGTSQSISTVGFQPDLVWIKERTSTGWHILTDSVRGVNKTIYSNDTYQEESVTNIMNSFDTNGFSVGYNASYSSVFSNKSSQDYVAWNFKAGGAAVTNTDGTITSQVSANTEAGFSVVSYTGNNSAGATVGHGLSDAPSIVIVKARNASDYWCVGGSTVGDGQNLYLNDSGAKLTRDRIVSVQTNTFTLGSHFEVNTTNNYISYCFAEVEGFSNFGSYVGNGSTQSIVTGFEPAFVMLKRANGVSNWAIADNKRTDGELLANVSDAERIENTPDFLSNGFNFTTERYNSIGEEWIYMAFAADPTTIEPSLEDSFNTVLYTGDGTSSNEITGVGFQPDLIWGKQRNSSVQPHVLVDSVRGRERGLASNNANAELNYDGYNPPVYLSSFDDNGFTLGYGTGLNQSGINMVAWCWKGAELPAINSNGSIPSVVSANPAAGFSIVSWKSTGSNTSSKTVGHGLEDTPNVVILKNRSAASTNWRVYHSGIPSPNNSLALNGAEVAFAFFPSVSSTNFGLANSITTGESSGASGQNIIAYCFAEVAGFSKLGGYNGSSSDVYINCGFEPAFVIVKCTNIVNNWYMIDNKRGATSPNSVALFPNLFNAEINGYGIYFDSTGFTVSSGVGSGTNASGGTYIYMAFANQF